MPLPVWLFTSTRVTGAQTIAAVTVDLAAKLGREPSDAEVAGMLAMTATKLRVLRGG
jgi:DNA-directed RNA polymerase specialized sigma subunit